MDEGDGRKLRRYKDLSEEEKKEHINSVLRKLRAFLHRHSYPRKKNKEEKSQEILNWTPSFQSYEDFLQKTLQSLDGFMIIVSTDGVIISVAHRITSLLGHLPNDIVGKSFLSLLPDDEKNEVFSKMAFRISVSSSVGKHIDFCCHFKRGDAESSNTSAYEYVKVILTLKDVSNESPALFRSSFPSHDCGSSAVNLPLEDGFYLVGTICVLRAQTLQSFFRINEPSEVGPLVPNSDEDRPSEDHRSVQVEGRCSGMESSEFEIVDAEEPANTIEIELSESPPSTDDVDVNPVMCDDSITVSMPSIPASHEMYSSQRFESEPKMGHVTYICELNHVHKVDDMDEKDESHKEVQENQEDEEDQEEDEEDQEEDEEDQEEDEEDQEEDEEDQEEDEEDQEEDEEDQEEDEEDQEEDEEDQEDQEDQEDKEDQEDQKEQEYQLSLHITSYIKRREEEMMKKFQEQLNEKTQILQAEIKNQRSSLETLKDKLREMRNSKSQALPSTTGHVHSPDLLEPAPKKPRFEAMKSPFSNISETTSVSGSCLPYSSQFTKELQQTFDTSSQVPIKEVKQQHQEQQQQQKQQEQQPQQKQQEQQPQQQEQQQQEQQPQQQHQEQQEQQPQQQQQEQQQQQQEQQQQQQQPQQYNTSGENQVLHAFLPSQPSFSMLRYNDGFMPLPRPLPPPPRPPPPPPPPPPIFPPIRMGAEQQPPGYYRADNLNASGYYPAESLIGRENGRLRFFPENQHQPRMNLFSMAHGPGSHTMYSTNLPQTTTITHNPQLVTLETPQDYVRLWQRPQGPQSHFYQVVQLSNWTPNEQTTLGQAASAQVAPTEQVQHSSGPGTVQASGNYGPYQLNSCMSSQQSHLNP